MYKTVRIGTKDVEMLATASTALRYKQVFKEDLLVSMTEISDDSVSDFLDTTQKLAYIMQAHAKKADMMKLSYEGYLEFLDEFDPLDFIPAGREIVSVYRISENTMSESKKKEEEQSED